MMPVPTSSNPLHDLLVSLLELEHRAEQDLERRAHPIAVARLLKGKELLPGRKISKKQRDFIKAVQQGKWDIREVFRSDQPLLAAYWFQLSQAKHDLAAPLVRDSNKTVNGRIETRRSPLNLALHELVIAGIGTDENQIRDYLVNLNPFWGRGPDPSIAKSLADMHEKGVTDTILQKLRRQHRQLFKGGVFLRPDERAAELELPTPDKPPLDDEPAWERLRLREEDAGDDIASLAGREYRLRAASYTFLKDLQDARGKMILAQTLTAHCGSRADRIYEQLPPQLQAIVEKPGKSHQGYRML
jgi:hypothetical protein